MKVSLFFPIFVTCVSATFTSTFVNRKTKTKITKKHAKNNVGGGSGGIVEVVPLPKPKPIVNPVKEKGDLRADIDKALSFQAQLKNAFMFDANAADHCAAKSDDHETCLYDIHTKGSTEYTCLCRTTTAAEAFRSVDTNDDDVVTWEEIQVYNEKMPCVFPFTYTTNEGVTITSDSCITDDDAAGHEWCSTRTYENGEHSKGFFRYCNTDEVRLAWEDAIRRYGGSNDELTFDEVVTHARRRRMARRMKNRRKLEQLSRLDAWSPHIFGSCDDCEIPDHCRNPFVNTFDGECRNYIKARPFGDEEGDEDLLRMLATVMKDAYCPSEDPSRCPLMAKGGMENWLTRTKNHVYGNGDVPALFSLEMGQALSCMAIIGAASQVQNMVRSTVLYETVQFFFSDAEDDEPPEDTWVIEECRRVLENNRLTDGRNAIQWSIYTINQGPHQGKKIMGIMGTDFANNPEQGLADIWSVPLGNSMIETMAAEAAVVATNEGVDFVTGHSLGGILAEMVCSLTSIEGASFAALGAFDPFVPGEQVLVDSEVASYQLTLSGYDEADIETLSEEYKEDLITTRYNGNIKTTGHDGVKFHVVINTNDLLCRSIGSMDGAKCSHISKSCDIRWLWFGDQGLYDSLAGHASNLYMLYTNAHYTTGNDQVVTEATVDDSKLFLPGTEKNPACDYCENDSYCESGSCDRGRSTCYGQGGRYPTFCPSGSDTAVLGNQAVCSWSSECMSGRCETPVSSVAWIALGYGIDDSFCYDKLAEGEICNENSDCQSNYCTWWGFCGEE